MLCAFGSQTKNLRTCHLLWFQLHDKIASTKTLCGLVFTLLMHLLCSVSYVMHLLHLDYTLPRILRHFFLLLSSIASFNKDILVSVQTFLDVSILAHVWLYAVSDCLCISPTNGQLFTPLVIICTRHAPISIKLSYLALDTASVRSIIAIIFDILIFMVCLFCDHLFVSLSLDEGVYPGTLL